MEWVRALLSGSRLYPNSSNPASNSKPWPRPLLLALLLTLALAAAALAQTTSTTGTVVGSVFDPKNEAIPGATLQLKNTATNLVTTQTSNASGHFAFLEVIPGTYTLTVSAKGFETRVVTNLAVEVNKSSTVNPVLQLGAATQTVEVTAGAAAQLQTQDATIGNVVNQTGINELPTQTHDAVELLSLQPGVVGTEATTRVNGAIDDQNTIKLDGIDISGAVLAGATTSTESLPTPVDSVEEFRVGVGNNNASFNDSSGADITLVGRRGTNTTHGAAYWYNQNEHFNGNTWVNNHQHIAITPYTDNRFGGRLGGAIRKNKDFYFFNYEGRRFPQTSDVNRTVPTANLRNGILTFQDASGNIDMYNLATSMACGPAGNAACDPRGIGISPAVKQLYAEDPVGNNSALGDGLNTTGYSAAIKTPLNTDYEVLRYDHDFNSKWQFHGSETYYRQLATSDTEVDLLSGVPEGTLVQPVRDLAYGGTLVAALSPTLVNNFTFGLNRATSVSQPLSPTAAAAAENLPGTNTADGFIALQDSAVNLPVDNSASAARYQWTEDNDYQWTDDMTKLMGNHTLAMGLDIRNFPDTHSRNDKVVAGNSSLAAVINGGTFVNIPAVDEPQACSTTLTTNCLPTASDSTWNALYASTLGIIDNVNIEAARNAQLQPLPFGTYLNAHATWQSYNFYASDIWRLTPSLTFNYGLAYGWQTPPVESTGKQVVLEAAGTGMLLTAQGYMDAKEEAAEVGQIYNPQLAYVPVDYAHEPVFNTDWGDVSPRLGVAWNPSMGKGLLGRLVGNRKTVVRAGFNIVYDRENMVQNVEIPMLGVGFAQTLTVAAPLCNASGAPGPGCNPTATSNPGLSSFRVDEDGTIPLPTFPTITNPQNGVIPATAGEQVSFQLDPDEVVGRSTQTDFTVQRELPAGFILEVGYSANYGRDLPMAVNFNNNPYMFLDPASQQTFAQAYNILANEVLNKQAITPQPWFQDEVPGGTTTFVSQNSSLFANADVSNIFTNIDNLRAANGLEPFDNQQVEVLFMRTHLGFSNYQSGIVTLKMPTTHGFNLDLNYTRAKELSNDGGADQDSAGFFQDSFDTMDAYGYDPTDRLNAFNGIYTYNPPHFGFKGWLGVLANGWFNSGIITFNSGAPLTVSESSQVFGGGLLLGNTTAAIPTVPTTNIQTGYFPNTSSATVATKGNVSAGGLGVNYFQNPAAVYSDFRTVQLGVDGRSGNANPFWGFPLWNWDATLGKNTNITEKVVMQYSIQAFNVLNHPTWSNPSLGLFGTSAQTFGVLTGKTGNRVIEMGLRFDF